MGAAASLMEVDGNVELSEAIKAEYERLKGEGATDEAIEVQLKEKFSEPSATKPSAPISDAGQKLDSRAKTRKTIVVQKPVQPKGGGGRDKIRRRSYAEPTSIEVPIVSAADAVVAADKTSAEPVIISSASANTENRDTWDSVTQQPSCAICQQTFSKQSLLDRHIKYSDLHMKNVEKMKGIENMKDEAPALAEVEKKMEQQVEGEHYKQLYAGSKMFWRTKDNIDLHIYLHVIPDCIEVVPFDIERHKELDRLYLEHYILLNVLESEALRKVEARKEELRELKKKDRLNSEVLPSDEIMLQEAKRTILVSHILDRLQQVPSANGSMTLTYVQPFQLNSTDKLALLASYPSILVPVHITRRRRSTADEAMSLMTALAEDSKDLARATGHAEKITNLLFMSTGSLQSIAKKKQAVRDKNYNVARMRWIDAIDRVLVQNCVKRYTVLIEAFEAKLKMQKKTNPTASSPIALSPTSNNKTKQVY